MFGVNDGPPHSFSQRAKWVSAREHPKDVDQLIEDWLADFGEDHSQDLPSANTDTQAPAIKLG